MVLDKNGLTYISLTLFITLDVACQVTFICKEKLCIKDDNSIVKSYTYNEINIYVEQST